ncbi:MAG: hypothetical protein K0Q76_2193 [Panacagrimonas sp.]|jgi:hypothetical protein|nr:hypothetical protein [Panacagrimonas sp.]MCC2657085.1 hypothetical protein [Panacagrimonas sp.]
MLGKKKGSQFTHVTCTGLCGDEFLIGTTAMRILGRSESADRRAQVRQVVAMPAPEGRIHVVGWSMSNDNAEISVESRDAWLNR